MSILVETFNPSIEQQAYYHAGGLLGEIDPRWIAACLVERTAKSSERRWMSESAIMTTLSDGSRSRVDMTDSVRCLSSAIAKIGTLAETMQPGMMQSFMTWASGQQLPVDALKREVSEGWQARFIREDGSSEGRRWTLPQSMRGRAFAKDRNARIDM